MSRVAKSFICSGCLNLVAGKSPEHPYSLLNEYSLAKDGSLWDAELQRDVRLGLATVYHLSPVVEELHHPAESTAVSSKPSFKHVHEDRIVDGVEGG